MKNEITGMRLRLIVMNFLQFAVWGAYLTSMGTYLFNIGLGAKIGLFYAMQGIVSLFMPAIMGIIADRWVPAQKLYGFCHFMAAVFMVAAGWYGYVDDEKKLFLGRIFNLGGCLSGCEPAWIPSGSRRIFTVVYRCMHRRDCGEYPTCSLWRNFISTCFYRNYLR